MDRACLEAPALGPLSPEDGARGGVGTDQTHSPEAEKESRGRTFEGNPPGAHSTSDLDLGCLTCAFRSHPVSSSLSDAAGGGDLYLTTGETEAREGEASQQ